MSDAPENTQPEVKAPLEIIRGRMPVMCVYLARFEFKFDTPKDLAAKFGTTVGKIMDIRGEANFKYVTETFRPTSEQKKEGIEWLRRHPYYDAQNVDQIVTMIDNFPLATDAEAAAYAEISRRYRAQLPKTKTGEVADAGGGNRQKPKKTKNTDAPESPEPSAEELLA